MYVSGSSLTGSSGSGGGSAGKQPPFHRPVLQQQSVEMLVSIISDEEKTWIGHSGGPVNCITVTLFKLNIETIKNSYFLKL